MKKPLETLSFFPVIVVGAIISAIIGMVAVAMAFVVISALLQLLGKFIGLLTGSVPWHIITFFENGQFVFKLTETAFSAMNLLSRWVGLLGGGACGIYLFVRRHRKKSTISA
ncbi:MAG: hypothetical protein JW885_09375 [Deltaproteobacteria bacterium]|nr:hypothetical protein [Candidatus Zymogenaceae bacterium]